MSENKRFSLSEEIANAISHGIGTVMAIAGFVLLLIYSLRHGDTRDVLSFSLYGVTLIILYTSSTFNHALKQGKAKDFFHNFDQVAIFLLIAGTYTPIALVGLGEDWGWVMFSIQWGFAITGIVLKFFLPNNYEKGVNIFFILSYVIMGWMLLLFLFPLLRNISSTGLLFIFIGGACYTLGTIFFKLKKMPFSHLIWHIFVIAGSVFHWIAIIGYILPVKVT